MNNAMWQSIASTPWWFYAILIYFLRLGFLATKPQTIQVKKLYIGPIVLAAASLLSLYLAAGLTSANITLWGVGLVAGGALGWLHYQHTPVKALRDKTGFYIPGSWSLLIIMASVFIVKNYYNYQIAVHPELVNQSHFATLWLFLYGLFTGLFMGRMAYLFRCLKVGPYLN